MKKITIEVVDLITPKTVKPWRAEIGKKYFFKTNGGYVDSNYEDGDSADDYRYITGNYFRTEEEAEASLERDKAIGRVTHRIIELNDVWEPDCMDSNAYRYNICFCAIFGFIASMSDKNKYAYVLPDMLSAEIAEQIIDEMKDDLRIIWGV